MTFPGRTRAFEKVDGSGSEQEINMPQRPKTEGDKEGLDRLINALCNDVLGTPGEELLAEVAEDYGDPRALAKEFDKAFEGAVLRRK